jgi:hypothetical protein
MEMDGTCNMHGNVRNECKILVRKPQENRLPRRLRCRWEVTNKMDLNIRLEGFLYILGTDSQSLMTYIT